MQAIVRKAFVPTHEFLMEHDANYAAAHKELADKWEKSIGFLRNPGKKEDTKKCTS